jgi:RNA-directed DNA polymerase
MSTKLSASSTELRAGFFQLETRRDIAELLEITHRQLNYYLYIIPEHQRYKHFYVSKKDGGIREIYAPATSLKIVQQKLNQVLQSVYVVKPSAHGFLPEKSILSNALPHAKKRFVLNLDLKDFFPSINFGRVRGLFMHTPYNRNHEVATTLAQICCFNDYLPQGAPTSPIVSNMICAKLDAQLQRLAKEHRSTYTRYADDITFSTSRPNFPKGLAYFSDETGKLEIGDELKAIVDDNWFEINTRKNRLQPYSKRQEVTGLTVNIFPNVRRDYVREIRGMLHAWQRYGYGAAEKTYRTKYAGKHPPEKLEYISFKKVIQGKLDFLKMIKGENNRVYVNLLKWFWLLAPELAKPEIVSPPPFPKPTIYTEGKTDWKHLKTAYSFLKKMGMFVGMDIQFFEYGDETQMGDGELIKMCNAFCKVANQQPAIFIFDRDKLDIVNQVLEKDKPYKSWGNNVFSLAIPVPAHRADVQDVCIELYYQDKDIKRKDGNGRRLFLGDEFDSSNNSHKTLRGVYTTKPKIRKSAVIDNHVYDISTRENIALSKDNFAELISNNDPNFHDVDFSEFSKIYDVIVAILRETQTQA